MLSLTLFCCLATGSPDSDARAALAIAFAEPKPAPKPAPAPRPPVKTCECSPACTCGCAEGLGCECGDARPVVAVVVRSSAPAPVRYYAAPPTTPVYRPAPAVVWQPYHFAARPAPMRGRASSGGC